MTWLEDYTKCWSAVHRSSISRGQNLSSFKKSFWIFWPLMLYTVSTNSPSAFLQTFKCSSAQASSHRFSFSFSFFESLFSPYVSTHSTILVTFTVSVNSEHSELCQQEQAQWGEVKTSDRTAFYSRSDNLRMDLHTHKISGIFVARIWCIYGCQKPICRARVAALNISKYVHLNWCILVSNLERWHKQSDVSWTQDILKMIECLLEKSQAEITSRLHAGGEKETTH